MKKLILSLFVACALTFGLQSCGSEECTATSCPTGQECVNGECEDIVVAACDVCGTFDGTAGGTIEIPLTQTDTTFTGIVVSAVVTENATAGSYNMGVDISSLLGSPAGTLVPNVDGTLSGSTITITNETYNYSGVADITINGTVDYDAAFDNISGSLALTDDAIGTMTFTGSRQ